MTLVYWVLGMFALAAAAMCVTGLIMAGRSRLRYHQEAAEWGHRPLWEHPTHPPRP